MKKKYSETIQNSLLEIVKEIELEDQYIRQRMLREAKRNELYWHGFQYIFWDERANDYKIPTHDVIEEISSREETKFIYDYVVNIFKAHGLSIIAALSAEVPGVPFSPLDADNPKDLVAAKKAETLSKLIQKYNKSKAVFYQALFTLFTGHFVAAYNYFERDENYGTVEVPKYKTQKKVTNTYDCTDEDCDFSSEQELVNCPNCSSDLKLNTSEEDETVADGTESVNKGMERFKIYGTLNIKIPAFAADQAACGYLIEYTDQHYAWLRNQYKDLPRDVVSKSSEDNYERIARMQTIGGTYSDQNNSLLTLKRIWLRPWMFDILGEKEAAELHKEFPKGCYFAVVASGKDYFAEAEEECLDDHWTITKGDLSRQIHADPLGKALIPMQDLENMVTNLLTESLEHSVPTSFADPEILDFEEFSQQEVSPGSVYQIKNSIQPNRRLEDYFYTLKTSTLPKEGVDFGQIIDNKGQFLVGAFPSIFGGPQTEGSKTLGEYQESRSYALQRLSIPYQLLFFWWADLNYKGVRDYIKHMISDEKHTTKTSDGKFQSISLLVDDFKKGSFERLLPEAAVDLPVSFSQKRSTLQQVVQLNSDSINQFLFSPENRRVTLRYLGLDELSDMDTNQVMKQMLEIDELLNGEPITNELGEEVSSIPVEPEIDDSEIHLRTLKIFLCGEGQEYKKLKPEGYRNCLLHAKEHKMIVDSMMMQQQDLGQEQGQEQ